MVVPQAKRVPDLVASDITHQLARQLIRHRQMLGSLVQGRALHEIPHLIQLQDVVPENHVGRDHFAGAGIAYMGAHRVLRRIRNPADDRPAGVFRVPGGIFARGRCVLADDRVLEARSFKRRLPILDAFLQIRLPFVRNLAAEIEHDRLDRLRHRRLGILLLQPIASDVFTMNDPRLGVVVFLK